MTKLGCLLLVTLTLMPVASFAGQQNPDINWLDSLNWLVATFARLGVPIVIIAAAVLTILFLLASRPLGIVFGCLTAFFMLIFAYQTLVAASINLALNGPEEGWVACDEDGDPLQQPITVTLQRAKEKLEFTYKGETNDTLQIKALTADRLQRRALELEVRNDDDSKVFVKHTPEDGEYVVGFVTQHELERDGVLIASADRTVEIRARLPARPPDYIVKRDSVEVGLLRSRDLIDQGWHYNPTDLLAATCRTIKGLRVGQERQIGVFNGRPIKIRADRFDQDGRARVRLWLVGTEDHPEEIVVGRGEAQPVFLANALTCHVSMTEADFRRGRSSYAHFDVICQV